MRLQYAKSGSILDTADTLGIGGQGTVYAVHGQPHVVAKLYDHPPNDLGERLQAMLGNPPSRLLKLSESSAVAWPTDALLDPSGKCVGLVMPRATNRISFAEMVNPATRNQDFQLDVYIRAARNLAATVAGLHAHGIVVGDLNPNNVLVGPTGDVAIIDAESMQIKEPNRTFRCPVGMPDWTPPEEQGIGFGTVDLRFCHDAFALGGLIFMAFMEGNHPFNGVALNGTALKIHERIQHGHWPYAQNSTYRPRQQAPPFAGLPHNVQVLFRLCFENGHAEPLQRPSAHYWVDALNHALACPVPQTTAAFGAVPANPTLRNGQRPTWTRTRDWIARRMELVRRHPRTAIAAVVVSSALAGTGYWLLKPKDNAPYLGGKPTPELWQKLRQERR